MSGSLAWLCVHSAGDNSEVTRNKARVMGEAWVMSGSGFPARELKLSPTITVTGAAPNMI